MNFLLTGSRVYGPVNPKSDLDIVVMYDDVEKLHAYLTEHNIEIYNTPTQDSYGDIGGFYFNLGGIEINIIIAAGKAEFELWERRTEKMKTFPPIEGRNNRISIFNSIT